MAITNASMAAKKRILAVCVRLFLDKGYTRTTVAEITKTAGVSISTFQNIFRAKDGVLNELVEFMFSNQFGAARKLAGADVPPVYVYAVETALQLVLTERTENLRDIYLEAYTQSETAEYINKHTAAELMSIFGAYLPDYTESDFYEMELGSAGIMRGYMARKCDMYFPLERKLRRFLSMSLRAYRVPEEELEKAIRFVEGLDVRTISEQVMQELFNMLAVRFEFPLEATDMEQEKTT